MLKIVLSRGASSKFSAGMSTLSLLSAGGRPFRGILGAWQFWRAERPRNSGRKCFRSVMTLARGAFSKISAQMTTFSLFSARGSTATWNILEIRAANDDPLDVFACRDAGTRSTLRSLFGIDDALSVFSASWALPKEVLDLIKICPGSGALPSSHSRKRFEALHIWLNKLHQQLRVCPPGSPRRITQKHATLDLAAPRLPLPVILSSQLLHLHPAWA